MLEKISDFFIRKMTKFYIKEVNGLQNIPEKGPFLIVANHASYFDHFIIHTILKDYKNQKVHFLTKKEAFDSYLSRKWHLAMGAIPLNRDAADTSAFRTVIRTLKKEKIVCIYPEGTRSPTGKMYMGKLGAVWIAMTAKVPIIPIGIESSFDILPRKRFWPKFHKTKVNIGKSIFIYSIRDKTQMKKIHEQLMKNIQVLSGNTQYELYPLPVEKEDYIKELMKFAYTWNERGIRNYPNDFLEPNAFHQRAKYICEEHSC
ncbi:MAG: 1-acyl-sn-glycerol-3-phosphate acyltransferase [Bacillales bacterium]|nr:1-acyl-sn-glycerol-3-phosphate acyltransferase [Bacillales bacterium]